MSLPSPALLPSLLAPVFIAGLPEHTLVVWLQLTRVVRQG